MRVLMVSILPQISWGVNVVPFQDVGRKERQARMLASVDSMRDQGISLMPVNIVHPSEKMEIPGWDLDAGLNQTTREQVDPQGVPLPFTRDLFDRAALHASKRGSSYFAFMNGDIILQKKLLDRIQDLIEVGVENMIVSRTEIDHYPFLPDHPRNIYVIGQDVWITKLEWWEKNRLLFPNCIFGVRGWDVIYTSIMLCHSVGYWLNTEWDLCHHVRHPQGCSNERYNQYNYQIEHGKWRIYSQRHNHYQYMLMQFYQKNGRMLNDEENARFISTIFSPPAPEEIDFSDALEKAFNEGRTSSYMQVMI